LERRCITMKKVAIGVGGLIIISAVTIAVHLLVLGVVADAENGRSPFTAVPLNNGKTTGVLAPGEARWYKFARTGDDQAFQRQMDLTLVFTPGDGNRVQHVNFQIFPADQIAHWYWGDVSQMRNMGAGGIVSRDGNPVTGELLWSGWVLDKEDYYIQVFNGADVTIDYWLFTDDVIGVELGEVATPPPAVDVPAGTDPNHPLALPPGLQRGHLGAGQETWYAIAYDDYDQQVYESHTFTLIFTPDDGNRVRYVGFEIFPLYQLHIWQRGDTDQLRNLGAGGVVSRDGDPLTGELLWSGWLLDGETYLLKVYNHADTDVDFWLFQKDVLHPELGEPTSSPAAVNVPPGTGPENPLPLAEIGSHSSTASSSASVIGPSELRGVKVQDRFVTTQEKADEVLRRAEAGHFNAIFVNVFAYGQALYESDLVGKHPKVDPDFNPLAYLVEGAHDRNIEVHAWFVVGPVSCEGESEILEAHPDWGIVGPDGRTAAWLNFSRPDVRRFVADLMMETVERYGVDGLYFDFMRYPGPEWGFDPYSVAAFNEEHDFDLNELRYTELPAYGIFEGMPLAEPGTAQVLAAFDNGLPAVTLNVYGGSEVVVLNWDAGQRSVAVGDEIMQRSLRRLLDEGGDVYLLRSAANAEVYGYDRFERGKEWLEDLGWTPLVVAEGDIQHLSSDSVLVLPNVYLILPQTAAQLADFVSRGGGVIFIDGVVQAIKLKEIQAITGMQWRGKHFQEWRLMTATGEHPLIPTSQRDTNLVTYEWRDAEWKAFRKQGINDLVKEVYRRVKSRHPEVDIGVGVTFDQERAANYVLQDWAAWLEGGYVDFVVPRVYADQFEELISMIDDWQPAIQEHGHITLCLKSFVGTHNPGAAKSPDQLWVEISMARAAGSNGVLIFKLDGMSDEQLESLAAGPFSVPATTTDN
jgi:uncharacterized lipoprotein YddW (UPF0748 family)